jgi:hypothetical protein
MFESPIENKIPLNLIEEKVLEKVTAAFNEWWCDRKLSITKQIFVGLAELGETEGYDVYTSAYGEGWVFDLAWIKKNESGKLLELGLCLESELSDRSEMGLLTDFNKLIIADSKTKVFICFEFPWKNDFPNSVNAIVQLLSNAISSYSGSINQRILVLIFSDFFDGELHPYVIVT